MAITRGPYGNVGDSGWLNDQGTDPQFPWITYLDDVAPIVNAQYYGEDAEWINHDEIDDDSWIAEGRSGPVVADVVTAATQYIEDAWDWSGQDAEAAEPVVFPGRFQQANTNQFTDDSWDWFQEADRNSDWVTETGATLSADAIAASTQYWGEDAELLDQDDDEQSLSDDCALVDVTAPATPYYGDDAELLAQDDDEESLPLDELVFVPDFLAIEDCWDWFTPEEDEFAVAEDYSFDGVLQYFGEDAEHLAQDDDEQSNVDAYTLVDNNPVLCLEDPIDWTQDEDDYVVTDDYTIVENLSPVEDAWDHFLTEDDDQVDVSEFTLLSVPVTALQYYGEDAELADLDQDDDEWVARDTDVLGGSLAQNFDDGWDFWSQEEDDYTVVDDYALVENLSPVADDWDHFVTDDDEQSLLDEIPQQVVLAQPPDDAWDYFVLEDDEQAPLDDAQLISLPASVLCAEDPWDHFSTSDDDDYYVVDDYELPVLFVLSMAGVSFSAGICYGTAVLLNPRGPYQYDPRFYNGSNAWLGYRTSSGGGIF